jgi:hypothetical protein
MDLESSRENGDVFVKGQFPRTPNGVPSTLVQYDEHLALTRTRRTLSCGLVGSDSRNRKRVLLTSLSLAFNISDP